MSNKKWFEKIPPQGVLCKVASDDAQFVHIKDRTDLNEFCLDYGLNDEDIKPIAPNEFWQFAPWQDIETITPSKWVLVEFMTGSEKFITQVSKKYNGFIDHHDREVIAHPMRWLPLPEESQ